MAVANLGMSDIGCLQGLFAGAAWGIRETIIGIYCIISVNLASVFIDSSKKKQQLVQLLELASLVA